MHRYLFPTNSEVCSKVVVGVWSGMYNIEYTLYWSDAISVLGVHNTTYAWWKKWQYVTFSGSYSKFPNCQNCAIADYCGFQAFNGRPTDAWLRTRIVWVNVMLFMLSDECCSGVQDVSHDRWHRLDACIEKQCLPPCFRVTFTNDPRTKEQKTHNDNLLTVRRCKVLTRRLGSAKI